MQKITLSTTISYIAVVFVLGVGSYAITSAVMTNNAETTTAVTANSTTASEVGDVVSSKTSSSTITFSGERVTGDESNEKLVTDSEQRATVTLAGGCFWCTEAYMQETFGVVSAISGYAGGSVDTANYETVTKGNTNHREAVQVVYDPARVSLDEILETYWSHIDPTDSEGQFADRGFHYTTAIFYHNETQRQTAESSKAALQKSGLFTDSIATKILPYTTFYEAEEYHQDYYQKASAHYERYKKASGRAGFIEDNWAKEAALHFFEAREQSSAANETISAPDVYSERAWTETEIRNALSKLPEAVYKIVAEEGTERAFQNEYHDHKAAGLYVDVVTGDPLFSSTHKYDSGTGWPAFYRPISESSIIEKADYKLVLPRIEVRSVSGHLGHVFNDGPDEYGGKRYCINSLALDFIPLSELEARGYGEYLYLF